MKSQADSCSGVGQGVGCAPPCHVPRGPPRWVQLHTTALAPIFFFVLLRSAAPVPGAAHDQHSWAPRPMPAPAPHMAWTPEGSQGHMTVTQCGLVVKLKEPLRPHPACGCPTRALTIAPCHPYPAVPGKVRASHSQSPCANGGERALPPP